MAHIFQKIMPPLLERYELKYLIPFDMIEPIVRFASVYCSLDLYSQKSESGFYTVNSLYLDTPGYLFLRMRQADVQNRFNMRVRTYGNMPALPWFLEIKQKTNDVVKKYRATIWDKQWYRTYADPEYRMATLSTEQQDTKNRRKFEQLVCTYNAAPVILTQYRRKALVSEVDGYARITFDTHLRFRSEDRYHPVPDDYTMVASDHSLVFDPGCPVILELKCYTTKVPLWMIDMIRFFNLERRSFSKYLTGMAGVVESLGYNPISRCSAVL